MKLDYSKYAASFCEVNGIGLTHVHLAFAFVV